MNLQLGDTAWHLSAFDMVAFDVDEVITPPAGETDIDTRTDAAVSCAVYQLSHHCTSNTLNLLLQRYQPGLLLAEVYLKLRGGCV